MKVLLDTNAYSALVRGRAEVVRRVRVSERVLVSAVVAGELLHGFRNGSRYEENSKRFVDFLRQPYVTFLPITYDTADRFGRIATTLRRRGTPIPMNDVWIAAHALEFGADLLSYDRHFEAVDGLVFDSLE